jgi:hypothetical protein
MKPAVARARDEIIRTWKDALSPLRIRDAGAIGSVATAFLRNAVADRLWACFRRAWYDAAI